MCQNCFLTPTLSPTMRAAMRAGIASACEFCELLILRANSPQEDWLMQGDRHLSAVPEESRRGRQIPWNRIYR